MWYIAYRDTVGAPATLRDSEFSSDTYNCTNTWDDCFHCRQTEEMLDCVEIILTNPSKQSFIWNYHSNEVSRGGFPSWLTAPKACQM